jgi:hypothetical protein
MMQGMRSRLMLAVAGMWLLYPTVVAAQEAPPLEQIQSTSITDGAGYLGLVLYQAREEHFDQRVAAAVIGGELQRLKHEFFFTKLRVEMGGALDEGDDQFSGFRYQFGGLLGVGFGNDTRYAAVGVGLDVNGDVRGAVPSALALPVEASYTTWLGSRLRAMAWLRGDTFLAAQSSRRDLADNILVDEFSGGARLVVVTQERQIRGERVLRGLALGVSVHRTMGSSVWMVQLGMGANAVVAAGQ